MVKEIYLIKGDDSQSHKSFSKEIWEIAHEVVKEFLGRLERLRGLPAAARERDDQHETDRDQRGFSNGLLLQRYGTSLR